MSKSKGKLELFNDDVETILSKEDNEVFYDNSSYIEFLNASPGTVRTKIEVEPQISTYDAMKKWYDLMQKCKNNKERFYGYYFDEDTGKVYRLRGVYISNITGVDPIKEIAIDFNYYDKKETWYPTEDEMDVFVETYIEGEK